MASDQTIYGSACIFLCNLGVGTNLFFLNKFFVYFQFFTVNMDYSKLKKDRPDF